MPLPITTEKDLIKEVDDSTTLLKTLLSYRKNPIGPPPIEPLKLDYTFKFINNILEWNYKYNENKQDLLSEKIHNAIWLIATQFGLDNISSFAINILIKHIVITPQPNHTHAFSNLKLLLQKLTKVSINLFELVNQALITNQSQEAQLRHVYVKHWICNFKLKQLVALQQTTDIENYAQQLQGYVPYLEDKCFKDAIISYTRKNNSNGWLNPQHYIMLVLNQRYIKAATIIHLLICITGIKNNYEKVFVYLFKNPLDICNVSLHMIITKTIELLPINLQIDCLNTIIFNSSHIIAAPVFKLGMLYDFYKTTSASHAALYLALLITYKNQKLDTLSIFYLMNLLCLYESYHLNKNNLILGYTLYTTLQLKLKESYIEIIRMHLNIAIQKHYPKNLLKMLSVHYLVKYQRLSSLQMIEEQQIVQTLEASTIIKKLVTTYTQPKSIQADKQSQLKLNTPEAQNYNNFELKRKRQQDEQDNLIESHIKRRRHYTRSETAKLQNWEHYHVEKLFLILAVYKAAVRITLDHHKSRVLFTTDFKSLLETYARATSHLIVSHSLLMKQNGYNNPEDPLIFGLFFVNHLDIDIIIEHLVLPFWGTLRFIQPNDRDVTIAPHIKTLSNPLIPDARCIEHPRDMTLPKFWNPPGAYAVNHNNRTDNNITMVNLTFCDAIESVPVNKLPAIFIKKLVVPAHKAQEITVNYSERADGANCLPQEIKSKRIPDEHLQCPAANVVAINEKNYDHPRSS